MRSLSWIRRQVKLTLVSQRYLSTFSLSWVHRFRYGIWPLRKGEWSASSFLRPSSAGQSLSLRALIKWKVSEDARTGSHFHGLGGVVIHEDILDADLQATIAICQVPGEELIQHFSLAVILQGSPETGHFTNYWEWQLTRGGSFGGPFSCDH